jgi:GT2 family glycosyltransferase
LVAGYAAGARYAKNPLLFFCNEDMYLDINCLRECATHVALERRVAAADPWQWTYHGTDWIHGGVRFGSCRWDFNSPFPFRRQNPIARLFAGQRVPFASAGAMMIHADVYNEVGGWDTSFFLDDEDVDLFIRVWQRNWRCVTVPTARVFHAVGASNQTVSPGQRHPVVRNRYISNRSNVSVIALKYFSLPFAALGLAMWAITLLKDLLLLRRRRVWLDMVVLFQIVRRSPAVLAFRRHNKAWNRAMPGERFFLDAAFADSRMPNAAEADDS